MFSGLSPQNVVSLAMASGDCLARKRSDISSKRSGEHPIRWFATPSFPLVRADFPKLTAAGRVVGMMFGLQPEIYL